MGMTLSSFKSLDAILAVVPAGLAPVLTMLMSQAELSKRNVTAMIVGALIGSTSALAAFRSTKFAASKYTLTEKVTPSA